MYNQLQIALIAHRADLKSASPEGKNWVDTLQPNIETNFKLPLGSLGIFPETGNIYYRLVMPLAFETMVTAAFLADVYDMVMYPMEASITRSLPIT